MMTEDEERAREWLERVGSYPAAGLDDRMGFAAVKRMVTRPALPKSPSHDLLADMMRAYNSSPDYMGWDSKWADVYDALYTRLTAPKTKTVEVWRVEYAQSGLPYSASFHTHAEAADYERKAALWHNIACIKVTGPHKQTVPA